MASPEFDKRGSFGSKRPRSDGSQKEGDWTCSQCGNVNFAFRTVCNRSKCGAPRPPVALSPPISSPYNQPLPIYFGGIGAPLPMLFEVAGRYDSQIPLPGLQYEYGPSGGSHKPYGYMTPFPPATFGAKGYGLGAAVNGHGYGFQGSTMPVGGIPDNTSSRKRRGGPKGLGGDDWICPECENVNFAFRTTCNIKKCGVPRPPPGGPNQKNSGAPEGSWTCGCGNLNYPFRTVCNRCALDKTASI